MNIEITIRTGKRNVSDTGTVKWSKEKIDRQLVTYRVSHEGAIREALLQVERRLRQQLMTPSQ